MPSSIVRIAGKKEDYEKKKIIEKKDCMFSHHDTFDICVWECFPGYREN